MTNTLTLKGRGTQGRIIREACSAEKDQWGMENVEFCTEVAVVNGSHVALSQRRLSFFIALDTVLLRTLDKGIIE